MTLRGFFQGVYIPREEITGWIVQVGAETFDEANPGPIHTVDIELDANGCLASGSIELKRPRHPVFPAYQFVVDTFIKTKRGVVPIGRGYVPPISPSAPEEYNMTLNPLENISMNDFYDGSLAGGAGYLNETGGWTQTNQEIVTAALKDRPKASIGVDFAGRVIMAEPSQGTPVRVPASKFHALNRQPDVTLPYATRARWDGGKGWAKGEYGGISRPPYAERRGISAGEVTFVEKTENSGPPIVTVAELVVNPGPPYPEKLIRNGGDGIDSPVIPENAPADNDSKPQQGVTPPENLMKSTTVAEQYAIVHVYDLKTWYEGSALAGQESDMVTKLQEAVNAARESFRLAFDTLGGADDFTKLEQSRADAAANQLRLAKIGQGDKQSFYEPLTAKLSTGFVLDGLYWSEEEGAGG